jgi:hypothetical protein
MVKIALFLDVRYTENIISGTLHRCGTFCKFRICNHTLTLINIIN